MSLTSVSALWSAHFHRIKRMQAIQISEIYFSTSAKTFSCKWLSAWLSGFASREPNVDKWRCLVKVVYLWLVYSTYCRHSSVTWRSDPPPPSCISAPLLILSLLLQVVLLKKTPLLHSWFFSIKVKWREISNGGRQVGLNDVDICMKEFII